jgi:hypothetical protein
MRGVYQLPCGSQAAKLVGKRDGRFWPYSEVGQQATYAARSTMRAPYADLSIGAPEFTSRPTTAFRYRQLPHASVAKNGEILAAGRDTSR